MLSHSQIWTAIDALADMHGLSPSGLARRAGLDSTTFNRSKRIGADGRKRWPSTESIAKALEATSASLDTFMALVNGQMPQPQRPVPLLKLTQAGASGLFDDSGVPTGTGWDEIRFPGIDDEHAYALEICDDSMLPLYRDGDIIIVSPSVKPRRGDRIVVKTTGGEVLAKELKRHTAKLLEVRPLTPGPADQTFDIADIAWIARIVWSSQ